MRLVFFDPIPWDYTCDTPAVSGLGGSQSAACYLAAELAARGHDVKFVNHVGAPVTSQGVQFLGDGPTGTDALVSPSDAVICINAAIGKALRAGGIKHPIILWTGHAPDQPAVAALRNIDEWLSWDRVVCLSRWQKNGYLGHFGHREVEVIHHGIAPAFQSAVLAPPWYVANRPPVLAYTSTPFRGLEILLRAFPEIRRQVPRVTLRVFSGMGVYQVPPAQDAHRWLYRKAQGMGGVEYVGPIGQVELARRMRAVDILAYPCTFPETFCIAAAEAVSMGIHLISTDLAALPELYDVGAMLIAPEYCSPEGFASSVISHINYVKSRATDQSGIRAQAVARYRKQYSWPALADRWERLVETL